MINIQKKEDCVGCGACIDNCAHNAITWNTDIEGFWYPVVNLNSCVDCKLCERTCPLLNAASLNLKNKGYSPKVLAAYHKNPEVRFISTTGGLFSALAEKTLTEGGYICGAVWTENFLAKHLVSDKPEDLKRIRGSKYFQSDTTGIYKEIRSLLRKGKKVLVCGTPCTMAALRCFLNKDYDNLIIVDFICSSINSPKVFHAYTQSLEKQFGGKMTSYHPKNKEYGGWHNFAFKATFDNGKTYAKNRTEDNFTRCFIGTHIVSRPCCFECKFKQIPRVADITIADFWGIEKVDPDFDSPNGVSLVLLNNQKGLNYFSLIENNVVVKEKTLEEAAAGNSNLYQSSKPSITNRTGFYTMLDKEGFEATIAKYSPYRKPVFTSQVKRFIKQCIKVLIGQ